MRFKLTICTLYILKQIDLMEGADMREMKPAEPELTEDICEQPSIPNVNTSFQDCDNCKFSRQESYSFKKRLVGSISQDEVV